MSTEAVRIGDSVCLYSQETDGYVFALQSGFRLKHQAQEGWEISSSDVFTEIGVETKQDPDRPLVADPQVVSFAIRVANRYKQSKKLRVLKESNRSLSYSHYDTVISHAKLSAEAEEEDNALEQTRQCGKKLLYGQIIQLQHAFTNKYIHASTTLTSRSESSNMLVELKNYNAKHALFRVVPRYKVKAEGDVVFAGDQIVLESVKSPGQYLHVSRNAFPSEYVYSKYDCHELSLSVRQSGFRITRQSQPRAKDDKLLVAGHPIRLFHKEIEAYMVAEGLFGENIVEEVHFRLRPVSQSNPKSLLPSTSALTYWQFEFEDSSLEGGVIFWEQQVRIRHMVTRKYLKITKEGSIELDDSNADPLTVFRLHAIIKEQIELKYETYCRIEHVVTGRWLSANAGAPEPYSSKTDLSTAQEELNSMASLRWSQAKKMKVCTDEVMKYDDAFTVQQVQDKHVSIFNYMAGCVPFLQKLIEDRLAGEVLDAKQAHTYYNALDQMCNFMIVHGQPDKNRQKLLRNLRMVELLVQLLKTPLKGSPDVIHLQRLFAKAYDVLFHYAKGNSRKNELFLAKHIDFFQSQFSLPGGIGLKSAQMTMELIKDNRKIVDRITHEHIDGFIDLLGKEKNYQFLQLLNVLCVCDGVALPDNQCYIMKVWLTSGENNSVYRTELGQIIGMEKDVVYVSTDNGKNWTQLETFVSRGKEFTGYNKQLQFLTHQLDLFGKLCYGRNKTAIDAITKDLGYLTWEEAILCLSNDALPDDLRAKYCHLVISMFVDIDENVSVLDRVNLTFVYNEIKDISADEETELGAKARRASVTERYFPMLRDWITQFLAQNTDMTASLIGHNMLVKQVLRLLHYLVKYGYYGNTKDIKQLLGPLLSLLDGRNDKPFEYNDAKSAVSSSSSSKGEDEDEEHLDQVVRNYRSTGRFKASPECKAIVEAKHQAMEVLDLFFNFRFNTRINQFVYEFKKTEERATNPKGSSSELLPLTIQPFDTERNHGVCKFALKSLREIFRNSDYFTEDIDLVSVLMDLSDYQYDDMLVESMGLINRYFSAHDMLFKRAVQAQVLITPRSVQVFNECLQMLPRLKRLTQAKLSDEQADEMSQILDTLTGYCYLDNDPGEHHPMNQRILYNSDILSDIFDILAKEIDEKLVAQYQGTRVVLQKSFKLLQAMAKGNDTIQARLFDRLDFLLAVKGAEQEMADTLTEMFTGNKTTCMKVTSDQIKNIMRLASKHLSDAPQFLVMLNAIVKVEELNLPLKRNQAYVIKYFMQYRSEVAGTVDAPQADRMTLLETKSNEKDLNYLLAMVDMLSTCAEGENRFIESICQTIFTLPDLLQIITSDKINNGVKKPFLRFMLWVYMNTAGGIIESGAGDLPHDKRMWQFLEMIAKDVQNLTEFVKNNPLEVTILLKESPSFALAASEKDKYHGSLFYYIDAVMPALQVFFRTYYTIEEEGDYSAEAEVVEQLANRFLELVEHLGPRISNDIQLKTMVFCVSSILSTAKTVDLKVMENFQSRYGNISRSSVTSESRKEYVGMYAREEELNEKLNVFTKNYHKVYGGKNDIKTQLDLDSSDDYTTIGGSDELPLGQEFQEHMKAFCDPEAETADEIYSKAKKLTDQLAVSAKMIPETENERLEQERLDVKCLQLLRGFIHNKLVMIPVNGNAHPKERAEAMKQIDAVQSALNRHEAILKILPHLSKDSETLVREILAFMCAMLYGGNEQVQRSLIDYFYGTREEKFFYAIKNRFEVSTIAIKEQRSLVAQHLAKVDETIEMARSLKKAMVTAKSSQYASIELTDMVSPGMFQGMKNKGKAQSKDIIKGRLSKSSTNDDTPLLVKFANGKKKQQQQNAHNITELQEIKVHVAPEDYELDEKEIKELQAKAAKDLDMEYKDEGNIELVLNVLGLMCDGQNSNLQNYLREQPDNIETHNIVGETARFLQLAYTNITPNSISLTTQLFNTLVEFCSGNAHNQMVAFDNKVIDYINYILRNKEQYSSCDSGDILDLQSAIQQLVKAMTEENQVGSHALKEIMTTLDMDSINEIILNMYQASKNTGIAAFAYMRDVGNLVGNLAPLPVPGVKSKTNEEEEKAVKEATLRVAFGYYHLIKRFHDVDEDFDMNALKVRGQTLMKDKMSASEIDRAWNFYESSTMSIELLKDGELQKVYFYVKDQTVLRENVKELFKYEVDRASPTNKLRDLLVWSRDIMDDIKHQKKVLANPIYKFFVKAAWKMNLAVILLSILIALLILITFVDPKETGKYDENTQFFGDSKVFFTRPEPGFLSELPGSHIAIAQSENWTSMEHMIMFFLAIIHNILTICVFISYFLCNNPRLPTLASVKYQLRNLFGLNSTDDDEAEKQSSILLVSFLSLQTLYYCAFLIASILGTTYYGYLFAFHLLHITQNNQLLKRVILAVTRNGRSLLWVFILGLVIFYIYALILFAFFRDITDPESGMYCTRMYECFIALVHRGLILPTFDVFADADISEKQYVWHIGKWIFDMSFFIIITTIGLNIIFGIIVDTFSELRDSKWQIDQDMQNNCFICSRESFDFERHPGGFENHVKHEHCQWAYIFFFIHLSDTDHCDYSALELYVHRLLEKDNISFFPLNRALSLEEEEDTSDQKLDTLLSKVNYIMEKIQEQENLKVREQEEKKQQQWAEKHAQ